MGKFPRSIPLFVTCWLLATLACRSLPVSTGQNQPTVEAEQPPSSENVALPSLEPPQLLTVCLGQEPVSLFIYADSSPAARGIRQAIYDGPFDRVGFDLVPVILEQKPTLENSDLLIEPVTVQVGDLIKDSQGHLTTLGENTTFFPPGCIEPSCARIYSGTDPVQMDQQVVRFRIRAGVKWSDGTPLTADDSVYSFEVARKIYPRARANLVTHTQSYQALDDRVVEWKGVPGYRAEDYATFFFFPLPQKAWEGISAIDLFTAEVSSRFPMGWGPYKIEDWKTGDHVTLSKNPHYFRAEEGLPKFEKLVFRFISDPQQALMALQAGECDILDETIPLERLGKELIELEKSGRIKLMSSAGLAWEHLDFGINSLDTTLPSLFQSKETRQAIAMCLDRQRMLDELFMFKTMIADVYVPSDHPLYHPQIKRYSFDPDAANTLLDAVGWRDVDGDPTTPRQAQSVADVPDGTSLEFSLLTTDEAEKLQVARIIQESLARCGIGVQITSLPPEQLFAPGPEGLLFGRRFMATQFGWVSALQPPCYLFMSSEIPGPYPNFSKGWGGANAGGYTNASYDQACQKAMLTFPGSPENKAAHVQAQSIFAEDLPVIPLYWRLRVIAMRPDLCEVVMDASSDTVLVNLEDFYYRDRCPEAK